MSKVQFVGEEESVDVFGHTFYRFKPITSHKLKADELDKLFHNPTFKVEDYEPGIDAEGKPVEAPEPEPAPAKSAPAT